MTVKDTIKSMLIICQQQAIGINNIDICRLATEEEKQNLFKKSRIMDIDGTKKIRL